MQQRLAAVKNSTRNSTLVRGLLFAACLLLGGCAAGLQAQATTPVPAPAADATQIAFSTVVDLAIRSSSAVLEAQANLVKAEGALAQAHDVYIPSLAGGSDIGYSYGFPVGTPTIFSFSTHSLLFNFSQRDYTRAASAGVDAAAFSLKNMRQQAIEDAAYTYIQLDTALQQQQALDEQYAAAAKLDDIVVKREADGFDSRIDVWRAELTEKQILLKQLHGRNNIASLRAHLANLTGLPTSNFLTETASIPATPDVPPALDSLPVNPGVQAAYAQARAAEHTAFGDSRQLLRPEFSFEAAYNRFASFVNYAQYYNATTFQASNFGIGIHISLPVFDAERRAQARQSAAAAVVAQRQADLLRQQAAEGDMKMINSLQELSAKQDIARLQTEISAEQLKTVIMQLQNTSAPLTGNGNNPASVQNSQLSPKDEQNARIDEREKFFDLLDSQLQLMHLELQLLRASGGLETWAGATTTNVTPSK